MVTRFAFVDEVAAARDLVMTSAGPHVCRLEPRDSTRFAWTCDLDDGTPTSNENDPASSVRWLSPTFRVPRHGAAAGPAPLDVRRQGPHSDLGRLVARFGRLVGLGPDDHAGELVWTDPSGILDADLRHRAEHWPLAPHGDGVVRPAELRSLRVDGVGLVVDSASWWDSAAALDHQIGLALDVAERLLDAT